MDEALRRLIDKDAIRDLIFTYCRSVDRCDVALGHAIWHADGVADYGADYYQGPGRGVIDLICGHHRQLASHSHQVSNVLIEFDGPDRAASESYVTATMRLAREGGRQAMEVCGRYLDRWERREGRWGLIFRQVVFDHQSIRDDTEMHGHGESAARDQSDSSYVFVKGIR